MLMERSGGGRNNTAIYIETIIFCMVLVITFGYYFYALNVGEIDSSGKDAFKKKLGRKYFLLYA